MGDVPPAERGCQRLGKCGTVAAGDGGEVLEGGGVKHNYELNHEFHELDHEFSRIRKHELTQIRDHEFHELKTTN